MKVICVDRELEKSYTIFKSIKEVLQFINEDRSEDWTNYTYKDWQEGLVELSGRDIVKINPSKIELEFYEN